MASLRLIMVATTSSCMATIFSTATRCAKARESVTKALMIVSKTNLLLRTSPVRSPMPTGRSVLLHPEVLAARVPLVDIRTCILLLRMRCPQCRSNMPTRRHMPTPPTMHSSMRSNMLHTSSMDSTLHTECHPMERSPPRGHMGHRHRRHRPPHRQLRDTAGAVPRKALYWLLSDERGRVEACVSSSRLPVCADTYVSFRDEQRDRRPR
mmetsp:Transcript_21987/g.47339  ORF Transcript_21987/g.47339 Transcript_21987/m.47339 type:complete len:209 (-) Transcript_21987:572-1198(-)